MPIFRTPYQFPLVYSKALKQMVILTIILEPLCIKSVIVYMKLKLPFHASILGENVPTSA